MSEATEETLTPPERLALADLSFDDLLVKMQEIDEAMQAAKRVLAEGEDRKRALDAEKRERAKERHREARAKFACPHCGRKDMDGFYLLSPEGYSLHSLGDHEDGARLCVGEGDVEYSHTFHTVEDGVVTAREAENVLVCQCGGLMPIPKNIAFLWL